MSGMPISSQLGPSSDLSFSRQPVNPMMLPSGQVTHLQQSRNPLGSGPIMSGQNQNQIPGSGGLMMGGGVGQSNFHMGMQPIAGQTIANQVDTRTILCYIRAFKKF